MSAAEDPSGGELVLRIAVEAASEVLGEQLAAAFALGSLAHGGFAPLVSDVDLALILRDVSAGTSADVDAIGRLVRQRHPGRLSERLSIFWADWDGVRTGRFDHGRLPPVDRLDLLESGRLLHGDDQRTPAQSPEADELVINGAEFAVSKFDDAYFADVQDPARLLAQGARATTKAVLFPPRFLYTLNTHRIGRNDDAVAWYSTTGKAPALALAALTWRHHGIQNIAQAATLAAEHLTAMYLEFLDAYIPATTAAGRPDLSARLRERRRQLDPRSGESDAPGKASGN